MGLNFSQVLKPYGYDYLVSATSIPGPGNMLVVFATAGDFLTACVSHDNKVIWALSCGGSSDERAYTDEANAVHRASRALFGQFDDPERRCQKCGALTKGEEAYADGQFWCHPCADAYQH